MSYTIDQLEDIIDELDYEIDELESELRMKRAEQDMYQIMLDDLEKENEDEN